VKGKKYDPFVMLMLGNCLSCLAWSRCFYGFAM